jgi:SET domain-containing protein
MWDYPSRDFFGNRIDLGLDARLKGNYLRFVNHDGDNCNAKAEDIPFNNAWFVYYIAKRDILPGEEITVSYGSDYFATRNARK